MMFRQMFEQIKNLPPLTLMSGTRDWFNHSRGTTLIGNSPMEFEFPALHLVIAENTSKSTDRYINGVRLEPPGVFLRFVT